MFETEYALVIGTIIFYFIFRIPGSMYVILFGLYHLDNLNKLCGLNDLFDIYAYLKGIGCYKN